MTAWKYWYNAVIVIAHVVLSYFKVYCKWINGETHSIDWLFSNYLTRLKLIPAINPLGIEECNVHWNTKQITCCLQLYLCTPDSCKLHLLHMSRKGVFPYPKRFVVFCIFCMTSCNVNCNCKCCLSKPYN